MFDPNKNIKRLQDGFSMIEVMIVLAIAAIVLVGVLVAAQALQRSGRNQARQSDVGAMHVWLTEFKSRKGEYPEPSGNHGNSRLGLGGVTLDSLQHYETTDIWITDAEKGPVFNSANSQWEEGIASQGFKVSRLELPKAIDHLFVVRGYKCKAQSVNGYTYSVSSLITKSSSNVNAIVYALEGSNYLMFCQ